MKTQTTQKAVKPVLVTKPASKPVAKPAIVAKAEAKPASKPTQKPASATKPVTKPTTKASNKQAPAATPATSKAIPKNAVAHSVIAALDNASQSGGFYSRGIQYHMSKGNIQPVQMPDGAIYYALKGQRLIERIKDIAMLEAVKASRNTGKAVNGRDFMKAPKGAGVKYAIAQPTEGGNVSQAFFSSLFL